MDRDKVVYASTYSLKLKLWNYVQEHNEDFQDTRKLFNALCLCENQDEVYEVSQRFEIPWIES